MCLNSTGASDCKCQDGRMVICAPAGTDTCKFLQNLFLCLCNVLAVLDIFVTLSLSKWIVWFPNPVVDGSKSQSQIGTLSCNWLAFALTVFRALHTRPEECKKGKQWTEDGGEGFCKKMLPGFFIWWKLNRWMPLYGRQGGNVRLGAPCPFPICKGWWLCWWVFFF